MIYISKKKIFSVLRNIDGKVIGDPVKKHFRQKYFFMSERNIENITAFFLFSKDPQKFIANNYVVWKDSKSYIYESNPAFHKTPDCKHLLSKFDNIYIPWKIKENKLTEALRSWAFDNKNLFHNDRNIFIEECIKNFNAKYKFLNLDLSDFEQISLSNSGIEEFENSTLNELKENIETILKDAKDYFEDEKKNRVIKYFKNKFFLIHTKDPIQYNPTNVDDYEVKKILREIDEKYIKPINEVIIQICIKEFLDKKDFDMSFLEILNFRNCKSCFPDYKKENDLKVNFIEKVIKKSTIVSNS
ncbi:hypothetical protein M3O96_05305 [Aquiflexum sp. TKW24L]|uniref:hypothetical protein n=1 Tax=Aquiflexum sp. TKW24L TaxID=2942212 RepID=UPI0020BD5D58|nr:hypothetical protein [Aquiflexum sp. TKW24L]MCL6258494.1 hypothetical protein [Aquiflexum sp. TKW24L]